MELIIMKKMIINTLLAILAILFLSLLGFVTSCGQVILRDPNGNEIVKVNTFFKNIKFDEVAYQDWLIKRYTGKSKNVKAITPYGVVETKDSNSN